MKKITMVVTDLTRMQHGHVCIAGYDTEFNCIRPVLSPPGIDETSLLNDDHRAKVFPFAVIELDLLEHTPKPPHTEDHRYDPASLKFVRVVHQNKRRGVLERSLFESVEDIFGQPLMRRPGVSVEDGVGPRSLGTVRPDVIAKVMYTKDFEGSFSYRLLFKLKDEWYRLKITDLTFNYYCDWLRRDGASPVEITELLTQMLKKRDVYLRIGLSRGWKKFPDRCFVQLNGIHTFPDYLEGKTFADLRFNLRATGAHQ